jgi:prepilin-type N-terminal cleavage/methylation domain-containing protein
MEIYCGEEVKNKFFTLIELLVVVAIIGILVTLLLPSLNQAREKAKVAVCLSNQKQIAVAYQVYANSNGQYAVQHTWYRDTIGIKGSHSWGSHPEDQRPLNAYASPGVAECPSDKGLTFRNWNKSEFRTFGNSYFTNMASTSAVSKATNIMSKDGKVWSGGIMPIKFEWPDKKILLYTVNLHNGVDWNDPSGKAKWHSQKRPQYPVSFADGHAEYFHFAYKKNQKSLKGNDEWKVTNHGFY